MIDCGKTVKTYDEASASFIGKRLKQSAGSLTQEEEYNLEARDPFRIAAQKDMRVVIPDEYTLQLDIDDDKSNAIFTNMLHEITKKTGLEFPSFKSEQSKSGYPHRHVTVKSAVPMCLWQRIALQFALGSDPKRERLNLLRALMNDDVPIAFFEPVEGK